MKTQECHGCHKVLDVTAFSTKKDGSYYSRCTPCTEKHRKSGVANYVRKKKTLLEEYPDLCKEWDYERNEKGPDKYSSGSHAKVWWICRLNPCGCHKWQAVIKSRAQGSRGCSFCSNRPCKHNNLLVLRPDLCKEWDYEKNEKGPGEYAEHSGIRVWWICKLNPCGCHKWQTTIDCRTRKGRSPGCPFCSNQRLCSHNNLAAVHPKLCEEWDYKKNNKGPDEYAPRSNVKVWWKCRLNPCGCHKWQTPIDCRTRKVPLGCPFCSKQRPCKHRNLLVLFPEICKEWDYEKNVKKPQEYCPGSNVKVWWKCIKDPCGCHRWQTVIRDRTGPKRGCPFCTHQKLCKHRNLLALFPELCEEWDYKRNSGKPEDYNPGSNVKVWWKCKKKTICKCHRWQATINSRAGSMMCGCPYCQGKPCLHNNFSTAFPDLCDEWDYGRNSKSPKEYSRNSSKEKVWWICKKDPAHKWKTTIEKRTRKVGPTGCPHCCESGYSRKAIQWLESIEYCMGIKIQHAENGGEFRIPGSRWRADGYCKENNMIYEFYGTRWHGHPDYHDAEDSHPISKRTYGELYKKTLYRERKIKKAGFNLEVMWEHDWDQLCKTLPRKVVYKLVVED